MGNSTDVFEKIRDNYSNMNRMMVNEIRMASDHNVLTGSCREDMWLDFFRRIIPQKFALSKGVIIIDSKRESSKEVDICVYDEQYTPYVFQYNNLKFIPIEAVAVAIQCKSKNIKVKDLKEWSKSIKKLQSNYRGIARMATGHTMQATNETQIRTTPIMILTSLFEEPESKEQSDSVGYLKNYYDFILTVNAGKEEDDRFRLTVNYEKNSLGWWSRKLNNNKINLDDDYDNKNYDEDENKEIPIMLKGSIDGKVYDTFEEELKLEFEEKKINEKVIRQYSSKVTLEQFKVEGNDILSLNLQLNQLLMLLNNPMLFPHYAYAKAFNEPIGKGK